MHYINKEMKIKKGHVLNTFDHYWKAIEYAGNNLKPNPPYNDTYDKRIHLRHEIAPLGSKHPKGFGDWVLLSCGTIKEDTCLMQFETKEQAREYINIINPPKNNKKAITCISDNPERSFESLQDCAFHYGLSYSNLTRKACYGYFEINGHTFITQERRKPVAPKNAAPRIKCLTDNRTFKTITECAAYYGIDSYYLANKTKYNSATIKGLQFERVKNV